MAVREVPKEEWTKDGRKWLFEIRYKGKRYKSKKYLTKKEATAAERAYYDEQDKTGNKTLMTLGDLFEDHYEYQKDKVKSTTLDNYTKKMPHFKSLWDIKLDDLTIQIVEKWRQEVNKSNLATRTKNDYMKYLKSVLNYGSMWYDFNFSSLYNKMVNFTDPNEMPKEMLFYTPEEFIKFISVEDDIKFRALFEVLFYCGLRRGELRGLIWQDINFEEKVLSVVRNVVNVKGDFGYWKITTPKTKTSKRKIPIPDVLLNDLKLLKEDCMKYYGFEDGWFVFGDLSPIHPHTIWLRKNANAEKAGVKRIRIHDFRHSCASALISKGCSIITVARYLGHSKIDETLNTYSHMSINDLVGAVNVFNELDKEYR